MERRYVGRTCHECYAKMMERTTKERTSAGNCVSCGQWVETRDAVGRCAECAGKSAVEIRKPKYCEKCKSVTPHNGSFCIICNPQSEAVGGLRPNFVTRDGVRFYKGQPLEPICEGLLDGTLYLEDYPGFDIRFGRVCYRGMDVLKDEKLLLAG